MTGLQNRPVEQIIERFFGNLQQWPSEPDGLNYTQGQIQAICSHISRTGDCLWHAQSTVMQFETCCCAKCNYGPTIKRSTEVAR